MAYAHTNGGGNNHVLTRRDSSSTIPSGTHRDREQLNALAMLGTPTPSSSATSTTTTTTTSNNNNNNGGLFDAVRKSLQLLEEEWLKLELQHQHGPTGNAKALATHGSSSHGQQGLPPLSTSSMRDRSGSLSTTTSSTITPRTRVVIKIGTASLVDEHGIKIGQVAAAVDAVARLKRMDCDVLLVCSGAVGTGSFLMNVKERPSKNRAKIRALAAVGQARVIRELNGLLGSVGVDSAQLLLAYSNLGEYAQSLSCQNTVNELFAMGVVPIVNENDSVTMDDKSSFGDNDRLAAMVATVVDADHLFLLTDVDGCFTSDPRVDPTATRIPIVSDADELRAHISTTTNGGTTFSKGGMDAKITAAQIAARAGVRTVIMRAADVGGVPDYLARVVQTNLANLATSVGLPPTPPSASMVANATATATVTMMNVEPPPFGTVFLEQRRKVHARKRWLQTLPARGTVLVDETAARAMESRKSLLASGVQAVQGVFGVGDPIHVCAYAMPDVVLAVGFSNFASPDLERVAGRSSDAVVDRENLAWAGVSSKRIEEIFDEGL